jgi:hypothetical protein
MKNILIIGTGAVAAELTSYIEDTSIGSEQNLFIKGYIDYEENIKKYWEKYDLQKPVLGDIETYSIVENDYFVVGISDMKFRKKMINKIKLCGGKFINLIHPTATIARTAIIGQGNIINPYCCATALLTVLIFVGCSEKLEDEGLKIGWAMEDITLSGPVCRLGTLLAV